MPPELVYEVRYRWTRTTMYALALCCGFVLLAIAVPMPLLVHTIIVACFGYGAFLSVLVPASRKVALRVDASGFTLGGNPLRYKATTRVIPWHEVQRVFLWRREVQRVFLWRRGPSVRYLSVERPYDAPPLSPGGTGTADRPALYLAPNPQVPSPTLKVGTTRGMQAFSVDDDRLSAIVTHYAPSVRIVNLG